MFALDDDRPVVVLNRVIYSSGHLVFRSIESYRPFDNDRPINAFFRFTNSNFGLIFYFELGQFVYLQRDAAGPTSQSFAIETLLNHESLANFDCFQESGPTLRRLISLCSGLVRMRELNEDERKKMELFKREPQGQNTLITKYGYRCY